MGRRGSTQVEVKIKVKAKVEENPEFFGLIAFMVPIIALLYPFVIGVLGHRVYRVC